MEDGRNYLGKHGIKCYISGGIWGNNYNYNINNTCLYSNIEKKQQVKFDKYSFSVLGIFLSVLDMIQFYLLNIIFNCQSQAQPN